MTEHLSGRMIFLRGLVRVSLRLLTRFEVHGTEKFPKTGTAMFVMNHLHWSDPVIGMAIVSRPAYTFVADKWEHRPVLGFLMRFTRQVIFVARGEADRKAISRAIEVLKQGYMLAIAPEGTRSKTGALQEAHEGPAYLASRTGAMIVPVGAYGQEKTEACWKRLRRPHIVVTIGDPFVLPGTPNKAKGQQLVAYTDEIMLHIAALLPEAYRGVYAQGRLHVDLNEPSAAPNRVEDRTMAAGLTGS